MYRGRISLPSLILQLGEDGVISPGPTHKHTQRNSTICNLMHCFYYEGKLEIICGSSYVQLSMDMMIQD